MTSDPNEGGQVARSRDPWRPRDPAPSPAGRPRPPVPPREPPNRAPLATPLPLTAPRPAGDGPLRPGPRRADDRRIAVAAIVLAAGFLVLAVLSLLGSAAGAAVLSPWLPLHLALAGGASTAIAGVMPFFVAALAAGAPAPARLRGAAVGLVALGAALVAVRGIDPGATWAPVAGGSLYLAGVGAVALAVQAAGRTGLMARRPVVSLGYSLALVNVAIGGLLGTLFVAGWLPVIEAWARLRPAHAWTNVVGFVSLVIVATLLHFLPTVLGGRIMPRRAPVIAVLATAFASPLVVAGLLVGWAPLAGAGGVLAVVGAGALALEAVRVVRERGRWTSDPGWHRLASGGLLTGVAWYAVGVTVAAGVVIVAGASGDAWSTPAVGAPLFAGWIIQVLVASWTHLLPSIGPGGPVAHARQRVVLGRLATARLVALNAGTALLWAGWLGGWPGATTAAVAGAALVAGVIAISAGLAVLALRAGRDTA